MRDRSGVKEAATLMALYVLVDRITAVALQPSAGEHAAGQSAWHLSLLKFLTQISGLPRNNEPGLQIATRWAGNGYMYELGELPFNGMSGRHKPVMRGPPGPRASVRQIPWGARPELICYE